jgi:hypothetical protein
MHTRSFCPRRVIFEIEMRAAYLFNRSVLAFVGPGLCSGWIFCRLVQHGLRNANRSTLWVTPPNTMTARLEASTAQNCD